MYHLKPTEGRVVPDPDRGDDLPPDGRPVRPSSYWTRRLQDGDVIRVDEPVRKRGAQ